jgi:WD40 repeat protein/tetratricopeptide (TPR) repeat protein
MQVWRLDLPRPECIHEGAALDAHYTDFDAPGLKLIYESSQQLNVLELATRQVRSLPLPGTHLGGAVKCRPHWNQVAVCRSVNGESRVEIRNLSTGSVQFELRRTDISSLAWHPDGRRLAVAFGGVHPGICLWEPEARREPDMLEGHKNAGIMVLFNHAGDRLLSTDWNGMIRVWDVAARLQVQSVTGVSMTSAAFSNDDRYLASTQADGSGQRLQMLHFAPGRELRTLVRRPIRGAASKPVFSGDGQLLAVTLVDPPFVQFTSVAIFAWPDGQELGRLAVPNTFPLAFDPAGALWTSSLGGDVIRWPRRTGSSPGTVRFGPPEPVVSVPQGEGRALSLDGRTVFIANGYEGSLILQRGPHERLVPTGAQEDVRYGAISPDGSLLASGSHHHGSAKVWDAATGQLVKSFEVGGPGDVGFSPDGRWLVTAAGGTRLWKVPTRSGSPSRTAWEQGPSPLVEGDSHGWAFSPESKLLALGGHGRIRLVRPDNGAEMARLSFPEPTKFEPMVFSPDGGELLIQGEDTQAIHVWDVRLVRSQLAEMGLDWDDPASAPPSALNSAAVSAVEFDGATLVTDRRAVREYRRILTVLALVGNPFDARAHLHLGQLSEDQAPEIALAHYTATLGLQPDQPLAQELRAGVARRLGRWPQVVADATEVLRRQPQRPRLVFARAQALQQLGRHADAVADFTAALAVYPRSMEVYQLRAKSYRALGDTEKAELDDRKAIAAAPEDPFHLNNRAWRMVAGRLAERDAPAALSLALRAVQMAPSDALYVNTLGVAQYRNGLYQEALRTLEKSLALGNGRWDAFDLFFLAMCHQKLGAPARAQDCFDRATRWWREQETFDAHRDEELGNFRAEADACLRANRSGTNK